MDEDVAWFQALCQQLVQSPATAGPQFEACRDSEAGLDLFRRVLMAQSAVTPTTRFYALSGAQYSLFVRWETLAPVMRMDWMAFLERVILDVPLSPFHLPPFLLNKPLQFYVSMHKRCWMKLDVSERQKVVLIIQHLLRSGPAASLVGAALTVSLLEEFANLRFSDYSMSLSDFNATKSNFEMRLLDSVMELTTAALMERLSAVSQVTTSGMTLDESSLRTLRLLMSSINLMVSWSCGDVNPREAPDGGMLSPPPSVAEKLLSHAFLAAIFSFYSLLRSRPDVFPLNRVGDLLDEIRAFICALGQLVSPALGNDTLDCIFALLARWIEPVVLRSQYLGPSMELLTFEAQDFELESNLRAQDLTAFAAVCQGFCLTHGVKRLAECAHFLPVLGVMRQVTAEVTGELSTLIADVLLVRDRAAFSGQDSDTDEGARLLESWRFELLAALLDLWASLGDDLALQHGATHASIAAVVAFLAQLSAELFPSAFDQVLHACVCACDMAEEAEERADIAEEHLHPVLRSLAALARHGLAACLPFLTDAVQSVRADLGRLLQQGAAGVPGKLDRGLERMRLCVLVLTFVYIDDYSPASGGAELSSETVVNRLVLDALLLPHCQQSFLAALQHLLALLQEQLQESAAQFSSPALTAAALTFFSLLLHRYIDPRTDYYAPEILQQYPYLASTLQGAFWDPVAESILRCSLQALQLHPFEPEVVAAACACLDGLARFEGAARQQQLRAALVGTALLDCLTRLSGPALAHAAQAVITLALALHSHEPIQQILHVLGEDVALFRDPTAQSNRHVSGRARALALLTALARSPPSELDATTFSVLQTFSELVLSPAGCRLCLEVVLSHDLPLVVPMLHCCFACVDGLVLRMPAHLTQRLCVLLVRLFDHVCRDALPHGAEGAEGASDALATLLDILHGLSTKEFVMRDDSLAVPRLAGAADNVLPDLLLHCLGLLLPLLAPSALRVSPPLADKFISLVLFASSAHKDSFVVWLRGLDAARWRALVHALLALSAHTSAATARQALQVVHMLGALQVEAVRVTGQSLAAEKDADLLFVLQALLRMALAPRLVTEANLHPSAAPSVPTQANAPPLLTSDRMDAFANALAPFVVLAGPATLQALVGEVLERARVPASAQGLYLHLLHALTSDRGVSLDGRDPAALQKKNRQLFVFNFRDFMLHAKALQAAQV